MDNIALNNGNDKACDSNTMSRKLCILCNTFSEDQIVTLTNGLFFELAELDPTHWIYERLSEFAKYRIAHLQSVLL